MKKHLDLKVEKIDQCPFRKEIHKVFEQPSGKNLHVVIYLCGYHAILNDKLKECTGTFVNEPSNACPLPNV